MSFASQQYWNDRFARNSAPFDWLVSVQALADIAAGYLGDPDTASPQVLHIGCGTSDAFHLRRLVREASQIHNVDYADTAVNAAAAREEQLLSMRAEREHRSPTDDNHDDTENLLGGESSLPTINIPISADRMRWSCIDLLSLDSILGLLSQHAMYYDVILDKSTSDSISMGGNVPVSLPYTLSINGWTRPAVASTRVTNETHAIHPLHVLAVHLAALTRPGHGRWIVVSYSQDRFPFLPPYPASATHGRLTDDIQRAGFPHPHELWRLEKKAEIEMLEQPLRSPKAAYVHRPKVNHWLYVLTRTDKVVM